MQRLLLPKEHGAYFQLVLPMCAAFAMGRPSALALALAALGLTAFFAHEPILVVTGRRGTKARREQLDLAIRSLWTMAFSGLACVVAATLLWRPIELVSIAGPLALSFVVLVFVARGEERTAQGEAAAGAALAALSIPVARACGVPMAAAWGAFLAWTASVIASTFGVRAVVRSRGKGTSLVRRLAPILLPVTALLVAHVRGAAAPVPVVIVSASTATLLPPPKSLRRIGWMLAGAMLLTAVLLVLIQRSAP
jgi:hypothetical protein